MSNLSPLGKYATIGALATTMIAFLAMIVAHLLKLEDQLLDYIGLASFSVLIGGAGGIAIGQQIGESKAAAKINGLAAKVDAVHRRADAGGLPPAPIPEESHG